MSDYVTVVAVKHATGSVVVGTPVLVDAMAWPYPLTVSAVPGSGGTLAVEYSLTPGAAAGGTANWIAWPAGTVSAQTVDTLVSAVSALRFTAATSTATYELAA